MISVGNFHLSEAQKREKPVGFRFPSPSNNVFQPVGKLKSEATKKPRIDTRRKEALIVYEGYGGPQKPVIREDITPLIGVILLMEEIRSTS